MSEYHHAERPFPDQLATLAWEVIDQGQGIIPSDPAASTYTSLRQQTLPEVFRESSNVINPTDADDPRHAQATEARGKPQENGEEESRLEQSVKAPKESHRVSVPSRTTSVAPRRCRVKPASQRGGLRRFKRRRRGAGGVGGRRCTGVTEPPDWRDETPSWSAAVPGMAVPELGLSESPVHERETREDTAGVTAQATGQVAGQVTPQVRRLLAVCDEESLREELRERIGLAGREHLRTEWLSGKPVSAQRERLTCP